MVGVKDVLNDFLEDIDISRGCNYWAGYIKYKSVIRDDDKVIHKFKVESESTYDIYDVNIAVLSGDVVDVSCSCLRFYAAHSCKHIGAVLYRKYDEIIKNSMSKEEIMNNILKSFYVDTSKKNQIKKEVKLAINLNFDSFYNGTTLTPQIKIGIDKLYSLNNKASKFFEAFDSGQEMAFGKNFTYSKDTCYFNSNNEKIIDFLSNIKKANASNYYKNDPFEMSKKDINKFLDLIVSNGFTIEPFGYFRKIKKENPFKTILNKTNNKYHFTIEEYPDTTIIADNYVIYNNEFYVVPDNIMKLVNSMKEHNLDEIVFDEENLETFSKGILRDVKDSIILDDTVKDIVVIVNKPLVKLFFDFYHNMITCDIKLTYKDREISYFDEIPSILREEDAESEIINDLINFGFIVGKNNIYLDDIDTIGKFLEEDLVTISEKYDVYTSEKLKATKIKKDVSVKSSFGIGQDNILNYQFSLEGVDSDDIVNILESVKKKKKYYKLKSGDLLDLNNEDLEELNNLKANMGLDNAIGVIPKYRAIYLDSIKDKYHFIETNNMFDELISKFNTYRDVSLSVSDSILRDYQDVGVKWLYNIYKCGFGGILADEMGLGKSIQLIYFIKEVLKEKADAKILIVAPTSLIYNWKNEFDKFGSELKYEVISDVKQKRVKMLEDIGDVNVLITTYGLIREDKDIYDNINFEVIAIDEAQNIKNNQAQMTKVIKGLNGNTKFALTGTPLENSVLELWSIFDFIMPGYLTGMDVFSRKYAIKDVDSEQIKKLDNLKVQIKPFILRRRKKDVIKELPEKLENNIYLELTDEQKKLYVAEANKTKKEIEDIIDQEGISKARFMILQLLTKLRQICIDPSIVYQDYSGGACKMEELVPLVKGIIENDHKILLFSSYKMALDVVEDKFKSNNISFYRIDGDVGAKKRMELVERFNTDDTNVFLITLKAGGTGLNLTGADVVIHLDLWWNPQVENQATDRAHRIGQKKMVEVIRLVCKGTIEERILELQDKKKILSDSLIDGNDTDQNILSKLSANDIKRLLSMDNEE